MQKLISTSALSDNVLEKLLSELQTVQPDIQKIAARFVHFISGTLNDEQQPILEQLLTYGSTHYIEEMGRKVKYVDPLTGDVHSEVHGVVLMAHHAPTTYDNTAMEQIKQQNFYCGFKPGSVIVDVWRYLTQADVPKCTLVSYGNTRAH